MSTTQTISRELLEKTIAHWEEARDEIPFGLGEEGDNTLSALKFALTALDSVPKLGAAVRTLEAQGYTWNGGQLWKPPLGNAPAYITGEQPAPVMPGELHPETQKLVADFSTALAEKLYKAQLKYGYDVDWKRDGWPGQCQAHFHQHIAKGDPRDVAAYCAFMWYHGWKTEPAPVAVPDEQHSERFAWSYKQWAEHLGGRHHNNDPACYYEFGSFMAVAEMLRQFGNVQRKVGWNACRAAMQSKPVTAAIPVPATVNNITNGKPLTITLPDTSSKAFWSGSGKSEVFHPETYKRWVKEAIERDCCIARIEVKVK